MFSRCSSELQALAAAGCAAELVPGVSSALAAPLFAGMPSHMTPLVQAMATCVVWWATLKSFSRDATHRALPCEV